MLRAKITNQAALLVVNNYYDIVEMYKVADNYDDFVVQAYARCTKHRFWGSFVSLEDFRAHVGPMIQASFNRSVGNDTTSLVSGFAKRVTFDGVSFVAPTQDFYFARDEYQECVNTVFAPKATRDVFGQVNTREPIGSSTAKVFKVALDNYKKATGSIVSREKHFLVCTVVRQAVEIKYSKW